MTKIMHLVLSLRPGGRGTTILDLCQYADRARFDPFVCCLEEQGRPDAELRGVRVVVLGKKPGLDLAAVPRLARLIRHEAVQLVHAHEGASLFYGALAGRLAGRPAVVNTYHRSRDVDTRTSLDRLRNRCLLRLVDAMTAVSHGNRDVFCRAHRVDPSRVHVINSAIDTRPFTDVAVDVAAKKAELGLPSACRVIGAAGHMNTPEKGYEHLLRAFSRVAARAPDVELLITGDGPLRPQYERLAGELGIVSRARFLGFRPDMPELYRVFDVFALASVYEAFGLVSVEAMCAGKAVVATNVGGIPDIVVDGETGVLVPPADPERLAEAILALLNEPGRAAELGRKGKERALRHFGLQRMIDDYEKLYSSLMENR